ncbi:MAG: hypothetical protein CMK00_09085 [Planctomycetes bacterium]|nr:hypothetical protein [Planctomycetota bacterium]
MSFLRTFTIALASAAATLLLMGVLAPGENSRAGTALRLDLEQLVERSDLIIEGRVLSALPVLGESGRPETDYLLTVERTLWGEHEGTRILRLPGGLRPDGSGLVLPGMPRLSSGEDLVLLLSEAGRGGLRVPVGLAQGRFTRHTSLDGTRTLERDQGQLSLLDPRTGRTRPADARSVLDYAETMARIEAAANQRRAAPRGPGAVREAGEGR